MTDFSLGTPPEPRPYIYAVIAVVLAGALWGTTGTIQASLDHCKDSFVVALLRVSIGAASLFLVAKFRASRTMKPSDEASTSLFNMTPLALVSGICLASYNVFFFLGVANAGVSIGTAIALGTGPIWVTAFECLQQRKIPQAESILGQVFAIGGLCVLVGISSSFNFLDLGFIAALLAGLTYAAYAVASHYLCKTHSPLQNCLSTFFISTIVLSPVVVLSSFSWIKPADILPLIFLGVFATAVAFLFFSYGVSRMSPATAVILALVEPVTAWLLAILVLDEPWTSKQIVGASILLLGLYIVGKNISQSRSR